MSEKQYDFFTKKSETNIDTKKYAFFMVLMTAFVSCLCFYYYYTAPKNQAVEIKLENLKAHKLFLEKYAAKMHEAGIAELVIDRASSAILTRYILEDTSEVQANGYQDLILKNPKNNITVGYNLNYAQKNGKVTKISYSVQKPDVLGDVELMNDLINVIETIQKEEKDKKQTLSNATDNVYKASIEKTKQEFGFLYEPIKLALMKYQIKQININKQSEYRTDVVFNDKSSLKGVYPLNSDSIVNTLAGAYTLNFKLVPYQGSQEMVGDGFNNAKKDLLIDASRANQELLPEITSLLSRTRQTKMWKELPAYTEASYDKKTLADFLKNRPYKEDAEILINRVIKDVTNPYNRLDKNYMSETISLLNYAKAYDVKIDPKYVCNILSKFNESNKYILDDTQYKQFFKTALGQDPKTACKLS